jgi:hypothetical protein
MRAASVEPLGPYPGARAPWPVRCNVCGREGAPVYQKVRRTGRACAFCSGRALDMSEVADLMAAAGLEPLEDFPGSVAPWRCRCMECGREVRARHVNLSRGHAGCPFCSGARTDPKEAFEVMLLSGVTPLVPFPGTNRPWLCRCEVCGREVTPRHTLVRDGVGACVFCAGTRVDPADAAEVMRASGFETLTEYPGSDVGWRCKCLSCGRESSPRYSNVRHGIRCRYCRVSGFWADGDSLAIVYLMHHPMWRAIKVGVAREHTDRIGQHQRNGWVVMRVWSGLTPDTAYAAEQAVISAWRSDGIPDAVPAEDMPQSGWTETAPLDLVDIARTRALIVSVVASMHHD